MSRWQPDAAGRLRRAALELYDKRGFEETSVADIAARAGLTERTFFRHFADKREVLFAGSDDLQKLIIAALAGTDDLTSPLEQVAAAIATAEDFFPERDLARQRQAVITKHPHLQEREAIKLVSLSAAIAAELRRRGVKEQAANLSAEAGVAIFKVAFVRWIAPKNNRSFGDLIRDSLDQLKALASAR